MPYRYHVLPEHRLGLSQLQGIISGAELMDIALALTGDPRWQVGFDELWDARNIQELDMEPAMARDLSDLPLAFTERFGPAQVAVVVTRDVDYGLSKLFSHSASHNGRKVQPFRSMEEAQAWLSLPDEAITASTAWFEQRA
jgi:hypothetical protein